MVLSSYVLLLEALVFLLATVEQEYSTANKYCFSASHHEMKNKKPLAKLHVGGHNKTANKTSLMTFSVQMNLIYCFKCCCCTVSSTVFLF